MIGRVKQSDRPESDAQRSESRDTSGRCSSVARSRPDTRPRFPPGCDLCLGDEDLLDHDLFRKDPLLATVVGKADPTGMDRTSAASMTANQLKLWLSSVAYVLMQALRERLEGTELERATYSSIRLRLPKIGAQVRVSARRVLVSMASSYPLQELFAAVHARIQEPAPG